jgi:hypothetical protein
MVRGAHSKRRGRVGTVPRSNRVSGSHQQLGSARGTTTPRTAPTDLRRDSRRPVVFASHNGSGLSAIAGGTAANREFATQNATRSCRVLAAGYERRGDRNDPNGDRQCNERTRHGCIIHAPVRSRNQHDRDAPIGPCPRARRCAGTAALIEFRLPRTSAPSPKRKARTPAFGEKEVHAPGAGRGSHSLSHGHHAREVTAG